LSNIPASSSGSKSKSIQKSMPGMLIMKEVAQVGGRGPEQGKNMEKSEGMGCLIRAVFHLRKEVGEMGLK
jgi:hypothetical protein